MKFSTAASIRPLYLAGRNGVPLVACFNCGKETRRGVWCDGTAEASGVCSDACEAVLKARWAEAEARWAAEDAEDAAEYDAAETAGYYEGWMDEPLPVNDDQEIEF